MEKQARGTVVEIDKVMPFEFEESNGEYLSRMLIDSKNSESQRLQFNYGVLKAGCLTPGCSHAPPHDEVYYIVSGEAILEMDGEEYNLAKGMVVFIPAGVHHALRNESDTEDFALLTVWPGDPEPGANPVYDERLAAWGTTYREVVSDA